MNRAGDERVNHSISMVLGAALPAASEARGHKEEDEFASAGTVESQGRGIKTSLLQDVRPGQI